MALKTVIGSDLGLNVWHVVADSRDTVLDIENDDLAALDGTSAIVAEAHTCSSERWLMSLQVSCHDKMDENWDVVIRALRAARNSRQLGESSFIAIQSGG
ncbi:hypothetical protein ACLIIZ_10005 [Azonexus caeni]|uniref:hypothetical protein n=1 Tax=Azonexus caeni TaxID=266126 RepID=UPI003A85B5E9